MSEEVNETIKVNDFMVIRDVMDQPIYTTNEEELTKVLIDILSLGTFTKTFSVFKGRLDMTFESISEKERMSGIDLVRKFVDGTKDKEGDAQISQIQVEAYRAKVNIALQLVRIKSNGAVTNLREGSLEERVMLLSETPEDVLRTYSKYLMIFANLTAKAFNSEDILKN